MARFYIENFGCRATQADGAALERQFLERGLERTNALPDAEIAVLNTCTVTEKADKDARAAIRRVLKSSPNCKILVTGCYAQRAPEEVASLPGVSWVVGNSHKHQAAEIVVGSSDPSSSAQDFGSTHFVPIEQLSRGARHSTPPLHVGDIFAHTELMAAPVFEAANERTRPNLKVQDGCDNRCSFCVIPYVRGQSRSLPMERVIGEVQTLVEAGYREVVISGINLGRWGRDLNTSSQFSVVSSQSNRSRRFVDLVRAILERTSLEKLRISSVEPMDWTDELIELMALSPRIAKHAHVPMQSGSDAVLRRMHRKYRPWHYREKIWKVRNAMPHAAIGADVMVGFPGETEAEFDETRRMVEELPFTYLHVFTYSPRPGTPAAQLEKQVPATVAKQRNAMLRGIASNKKRAFMQSLVGREVEAITLPTGGPESTEALTENYLKLRINSRQQANRWMKLRVESIAGEMLAGMPVEPEGLNRSGIEPRFAFISDVAVTRGCTS